MSIIGIQGVNFKEYLTNKKDMTMVLESLKEIGYNMIQLSGVQQNILDRDLMCHFGSECERIGLKIIAVHVNYDIVSTEVEYIKDLVVNVFKSKYVGVAAPDRDTRYEPSKDKYVGFGKNLQRLTEIYKEAGLTFTYHNHDWEFTKIKGDIMFEEMYKQCPDVNLLIDTHWLHRGGYDMCGFMERMNGKFDMIHIKDYLACLPFEGNRFSLRNVAIGDGVFDFKRIIKSAMDNGCKYLIVEQDDFYGELPLVCAKRSYDELCRLGYKDWF